MTTEELRNRISFVRYGRNYAELDDSERTAVIENALRARQRNRGGAY